MEHFSLSCQVCLITFQWLNEAKKHLYSKEHRKKMIEVFKSDSFIGYGFFPYIVLMGSKPKQGHNHLITGSSLLTLCFSKLSPTYFYLCHVCDEKCPPDKLLSHLSHGDHCSNYFNYTDPNVLSYSWIPSMDMRAVLRPQITKDIKENGPGTLQLLELPEKLIKKLQTSTYSEVITQLGEYNELNKLLEAVRPKRTMIHTYQGDSNRRHPLLGMQHLVECICNGAPEKRYYLCTLCKLTLAAHMIIKHVLSFDHIFCYFKEWHPSTLLSKESYRDYTSFGSEILDLSKQTEEIHGNVNAEMKQVILDPDEYASINFACYAEALKKLESKRNENEESSLIVNIKPGEKLGCCSEGTGVRGLSHSTIIRCQHCSLSYDNVHQYLNHLSKKKHQQMLVECFRKAKTDGFEQTGGRPFLVLYSYLRDSFKYNKPVVGISLIVTFINIDIREKNIYVCFACEKSFSECFLQKHLESTSHLINTLLYQNPWRLPFAWENHLDVEYLKSVAWEEEKERQPNFVIMKVFDVPQTIFFGLLPPTYEKVMNRLQLYYTLIKDAVPPRETCSKLKQNERFPLLGNQFMVMYNVKNDEHTGEAFLCLLCERKLSDDESYAHVFSQEHVKKFLDSFHPGSLTSGIDAESLLDLAKQAAHIHPISNVQVIKLDRPIWEPCPYLRAKSILGSAKRKYMLEALEPIIKPRLKLVPRETVNEMTREHLRDNLQNNSYNQQTAGSINVIEESQKKNCQKPIDHSDIILKTKAVELKPETIKHCVKTEEHEEERAKNETLAANEKVKERFTETASEKMENTGGDTGQLLKVENTEALTTRKPDGGNAGNCQNREKDDCANVEKVENGEDYMFKNNQQSMPEKSKKDTGPYENAEKETAFKHQQLTPSEDTSCEELQKMPSSELEQVTTADKESDGGKPSHEDPVLAPCHDQLWHYIKKKSREPVVGLGAIYECLCEQHDTIYLCQCCSLITLEKNIIDHVTGFHHWKMYLMDIQLLPPQPQIGEIRHLAEKFETINGYGQAQVVELNEDAYNKILKQDFELALQTVKSLQTQKASACELPSSQSLDTSITLQCQHEEQIMTEKMQVVTLEIDNNSEDRMRHSLQMSKSGTNPTNLFPDSKQKTKDKVAQSPNCEPLKMVIASKIQGTSQTSASSLGTGATAKVTEAKLDSSTITTSTAESSSSTIIDCTKAAITLRDPDNKSTATTTSRSKDAVTPSSNLEPLKMVITSKISETSSTSASSGGIGATAKMTEAKLDSSTTTCTSESSSSTASNCTKAAITGDTDSIRKDAVASSSNFEQLKMTATYKAQILGTSQTSAPFEGTVTTANLTTASIVIAPPRASSSNCATFATKCRETTEKGSATISSVTTAKTNCTTNTTKLRDTDYRSTSTTMSATAAKTSKSTAPTLSCPGRTESKELSQTLAMVGAQKPKMLVVCERADVTTHIELNNPYTTPHRTTATSDGSEHKNPCTELSHTTTSKTKPNENPPKVGIDYLIIVSCEGRQQVYCELCSVRLRNSSHTYSDVHKLNYLKMKTLGRNLEPFKLQMKLDNVVGHLTEVEKDVTHQRSQRIQVTLDVYKELAALPEDKAIEKLKTMMRQHTLWETFSPTTDGAEALKRASSISPFEISSPDDDKNLSRNKLLGFSSNHHCEPGSKQELQKSMDKGSEANGLNHGQNPSLLSFNNINPEPNPIIQQPKTAVTGKQENSGPGHQPVSQGLQRISIGPSTQSCSKLSTYLTVKKLETKPIIGMGSVWECQGISRKTFYLCESCKNTISVHDICHHMVSQAHQIQCMMKDYSRFLYFLAMDNVPQEEKGNILLDIAPMFSAQERFKRIDAQVVMLTHELYERVQAAPFSEALKMVQKIKEQKLGTLFRPDICLQQKEARHKPEKHCLGKTGVVIDFDEEAKTKNSRGPVDVNSAFPHDLSTETYRISSIQPELTLRESQHQRPAPELLMQQAKEHSESPPLSFNPKTSQTLSMSATDAHIQSRKRPASPPFKSSYIANPHLTDPRQAKYARSQSSPETNPDKPATMTTLSSSEEKGTGPGYSYTTPNKQMLVRLIDLVKKKKKDKLSNSNAVSANRACQNDVEQGLSSKCVDDDYRVKENASSSKS